MARDGQLEAGVIRHHLAERRALLKAGAGAMLGLAAAGAIRRAHAAPSQPLHFIGWEYNPQIVADNVKTFEHLYNESVDYQLVPGEYHAVVETRLVAGQHYDMMYSEEDHLFRWWTAKWVRDVEDQPDVAQIKAGMFPSAVRDLSLPNGKLGGLPYYAGFNSFVYNAKHLDQGKIEPPTTWEAVLDNCRKLKKDKIAEFPYLSAWQRTWASLSWSLFSIWYSEGAKVFDSSNNPVFDDKFKKVLQMHRTMYAEGLVQPDIFTIEQEGVPSFATGQHSFMVLHEYDQKVLNDPKLSRIAGAVKNTLMPGDTRSTFSWVSLYLMGAHPIDTKRAWNLMRFFGGKAKDGQYHVIKRWALQFGLGTPYKEVLADPEIRASFSKWKNLDVASQQQQNATPRDVSKTLWFPDWDWFMMGAVQDYIRGRGSLDQLVDTLQAKVKAVKAQYPG
ncbi:MAG TPA: extracellular solute-binding protein [Acetobacteraceae bacterium]